ncbi:5'/3'-nucleotidase SurE [[Limnothrix rosea] IAM M-220]|uniref:5'/3'-nucleotidase SurE n=1 Tax=[Limnothrix rosea] IAM M-220 TaxID=454133 RepID=UPI00095FBF0F|nr:5'/3'-nucleotidase SurE [[Limnothrix rosea] IAM M-220]OKH11425.1 5'/3'-nucleotidase SurE [[Limnothrix rosea] IAM M-220]
MKFLLTNDDGIDAPGIAALDRAIAGQKTIVAPKYQMSECGHRFTVRSPITVEQRSEKAYAVDGTPADCARLGLAEFAQDVDWVLSGVNAGGNLGVDIYTSGTVAAVREATILGKRAIAFSHFIRQPLEIDWDLVTHWTTKIFNELSQKELKKNHFWNVNLPHLVSENTPTIIYCQRSTAPMPVTYKKVDFTYQYSGSYVDRPRQSNTDVDICFSGNIAITQISI